MLDNHYFTFNGFPKISGPERYYYVTGSRDEKATIVIFEGYSLLKSIQN